MFSWRHTIWILGAFLALVPRTAYAGAPQSVRALPAASLEAAGAFWDTQLTDKTLFTRQAAARHLTELSHVDWLGEGPHSLERGLVGVSLTEQGRAVLEKIVPLYLARKLRLDSTRSPAAVRLAGKVDASGLYSRSTVFVDQSAPLLVFVVTLFHELIHARDHLLSEQGQEHGDSLEAFNQTMRALNERLVRGQAIGETETENALLLREKIAPILLSTEHTAYLAQNTFLSELIEMDGGFSALVDDMVKRQYWVAYPMREFDFEYLMTHPKGANLNDSQVESYLRAHPFRGSR